MAVPAANAGYVEMLYSIRNNIVSQLADMTSNPKPDYSTGGGVSVSWGSHFNNLMKALEDVEQRIARSNQPFWNLSRAKP